MTREEQISEAEWMVEGCDCYSAFHIGAKWADENPQQMWHKWPNDKPENLKEYLVVCDNGNICISTYALPLGAFYNTDGKIYPIAWAELPQPPKFY